MRVAMRLRSWVPHLFGSELGDASPNGNWGSPRLRPWGTHGIVRREMPAGLADSPGSYVSPMSEARASLARRKLHQVP